MSAREEVLARIRAALTDGGEPARPAGAGPAADGAGATFRTRGDLEPGPLLDLLAERLADYRALVRRTSSAELGAAVSVAVAERGARRLVVPPGLDPAMLPEGIEVVTDDGLSASDLDAFDGVITGAAVAIAETGTIVLDGSPIRAAGPSPWYPITTCASCAPPRSSRLSPRPSAAWRRRPTVPSPGSAGRPPPVTSS